LSIVFLFILRPQWLLNRTVRVSTRRMCFREIRLRRRPRLRQRRRRVRLSRLRQTFRPRKRIQTSEQGNGHRRRRREGVRQTLCSSKLSIK
jgi:hypothetical protein